MPFLNNKRYLYFTIKNVYLSPSQRICRHFIKSVDDPDNSSYVYAKLNYDNKLQILENKLELMDKRRANLHEKLIQKTKSKLISLKNCICNDRSDLLTAGSVVTGLTTNVYSDVDVVFVVLDDKLNIFQNDFMNNREFRNKFMEFVGQLIKNDDKLWNEKEDRMSIITDSVVPIIKLNFGDRTKFDLQFCNHHTLKNTNLIRYYAASDPRYRKVYMYVKFLASNLNILSGEKGLLTSYQISILVAHFLQMSFKNQKAVLPIIPQICSSFVSSNHSIKEVIENLNKPIDVSKIKLLINPTPLASHLVLQFIDYFANFDFLTKAIYVNKRYPVQIFQINSSPKLQIFDSYSDQSISKGYYALEAFSTNMKNVKTLIRDGYFIDSFPYFNEERYLLGKVNSTKK